MNSWYGVFQAAKRETHLIHAWKPGIITHIGDRCVTVLILRTLEFKHLNFPKAESLRFSYDKVRNEHGDPSVMFLTPNSLIMFLKTNGVVENGIQTPAYVSPTPYRNKKLQPQMLVGSNWEVIEVQELK